MGKRVKLAMLIIDIREHAHDINAVATRLSIDSATLQRGLVLNVIELLGFPLIERAPQLAYPRELSNVITVIQSHLEPQLFRALRQVDLRVEDFRVSVLADGVIQIEGF